MLAGFYGVYSIDFAQASLLSAVKRPNLMPSIIALAGSFIVRRERRPVRLLFEACMPPYAVLDLHVSPGIRWGNRL
jgi:hypothetical protein